MARLISILLPLVFILPVSAQTIKKCQDADGSWHYGDHASFECEQSSRVTEIDERGLKVGEIEAPPTQEELDAKRRAEQQVSMQEASEAIQQRLDQRLLITYDSPESILLTRDALLAALDSAIEADQILKGRLVEELERLEGSKDSTDIANAESIKNQIAQFDEAIRDRRAKRELAREKYDMEHKRYMELTDN